MSRLFLLVLFIGLILRLTLVGNPGFEADISFWKSWSLAAIDHGIVWTTHNTNINYPPGFIYVLWLMGKIYSLFGDPGDYNSFWKVNNFGFLLASKSIAIVSDIIIACLIYWFFSQKEKLKQLGVNLAGSQLLLSTIFFLNPVVILDSAIWGQVESFGILFTLVAIIMIFYKKPLLATAIFTVGTMMKLQNIIYIPLYFLFIMRYFDLKTAVKCLGIAAFAFLLINLPFILANDMNQVLYLLTVNSDYFPWLSLNAHNLWWIVAKAAGMQVSDRITVLGILNAKTVGLIIFASSYLFTMLFLYRRPTTRNFLLSLILAIFAFFLFTTQSHERYSYPVVVLLLFLYPFLKDEFLIFNSKFLINFKFLILKFLNIKNLALNKNLKFEIRNYFWIIYILLTITIFYNIHTGFVLNYPRNGLVLLSDMIKSWQTIGNSYILIILFFLLLPFVLSQISILLLVLCSSLVVIGLIVLNFSYFSKGNVSLTAFKPIITSQEFGVLQINRAVNSFSGWKSWNRLSNNYFYYRKGFGTHAKSNQVFDTAGLFRRFTSDVGIDTEAPTAASVYFIVKGDGKELYKSPKMGRFDFPQHLDVDISGVKYLSLLADDAGDGINSDHADWLNPMLYK